MAPPSPVRANPSPAAPTSLEWPGIGPAIAARVLDGLAVAFDPSRTLADCILPARGWQVPR
ncbi:hypothetical protein [Mycetohabitans rhizoxinica]|uniref:hypothetical protein n=1 Tax=Mycetohabitans rhizoxinica TaxID=412963 RepID=UPI0030CB9A9C